jgi:ABC-type bacteriocin/lantibiotic exporter with double-glycine peptidase domain
VDAHVGKAIFDNCVAGELDGKTRVLVTHQLQFLHQADQIIVLKDGRIGTTPTHSRNFSFSFSFFLFVFVFVLLTCFRGATCRWLQPRWGRTRI